MQNKPQTPPHYSALIERLRTADWIMRVLCVGSFLLWLGGQNGLLFSIFLGAASLVLLVLQQNLQDISIAPVPNAFTDPPLLGWKYSKEEWQDYLKSGYRKKRGQTIFLAFWTLSIAAGVSAYFASKNAPEEQAALFWPMVAFFGLVLLALFTWFGYHRLAYLAAQQTPPGEFYLSDGMLWTSFGHFMLWGSSLGRGNLVKLGLLEGKPSRLRFVFLMGISSRRQPVVIEFPVPTAQINNTRKALKHPTLSPYV